MNMDDVRALMKEVGWGDLATTDGRTVGVRPMGGWAWKGKELWCATGANSDKIKQLRKVPQAEYCITRRDGLHVRIAGTCTISDDAGDKQWLWEACPLLRKHIPDPASPEYVVIRMTPTRVRAMMDPTAEAYEEIEPR